jgi:hypothetical protein
VETCPLLSCISGYEGQEIKETVLRRLGHRYCVKEKRQEKVGIFRVDTWVQVLMTEETLRLLYTTIIS